MKKIMCLFILLGISVFSWSQYIPASGGELVHHDSFSLSYIENYEQAEWVYYVILPGRLEGQAKRSDNFRADPKISTSSASPDDYKGTGFDRGHLCPAADMNHCVTAMSETFYMSNMSPQQPSFNRGVWKKLESTVRHWASIGDTIHIATAGILNDDLQRIGYNRVAIPEYFYKVIYVPAKQKMIAFLLPNQSSTAPLESCIVSVDEIEALTGIDFFPQLPDDMERQLEASSDVASWIFDVKPGHSPQRTIVQNPESNNPANGQCQGTTNSGTQCKRKASAGSNYCWQHKNTL